MQILRQPKDAFAEWMPAVGWERVKMVWWWWWWWWCWWWWWWWERVPLTYKLWQSSQRPCSAHRAPEERGQLSGHHIWFYTFLMSVKTDANCLKDTSHAHFHIHLFYFGLLSGSVYNRSAFSYCSELQHGIPPLFHVNKSCKCETGWLNVMTRSHGVKGRTTDKKFQDQCVLWERGASVGRGFLTFKTFNRNLYNTL